MNQDSNYIFTLEIAVRDYELDSEGIVTNAIYLSLACCVLSGTLALLPSYLYKRYRSHH